MTSFTKLEGAQVHNRLNGYNYLQQVAVQYIEGLAATTMYEPHPFAMRHQVDDSAGV
jgi:hypothetical protein